MTDRFMSRVEASVEETDSAELEQLLRMATAPVPPAAARIDGVRIGTIVGFDDAATPLVTYPEQPLSAAQPARATVDLHSADIGKPVVVMFEHADPRRPIVLGRLHEPHYHGAPGGPDHVEVEADGQRLVVSARDRIVLRCGKASLTLTKEGKVIIQGAYVSNQSSGVLRLKGGSVQIN
jgi:hypothetical protein